MQIGQHQMMQLIPDRFASSGVVQHNLEVCVGPLTLRQNNVPLRRKLTSPSSRTGAAVDDVRAAPFLLDAPRPFSSGAAPA